MEAEHKVELSDLRSKCTKLESQSLEATERHSESVEKLKKKSKKQEDALNLQIVLLKSQAADAKTESSRLAAEVKQDARKEKQQQNQKNLFDRMCNINGQSQYPNYPGNYADPGARTSRNPKKKRYANQDYDSDNEVENYPPSKNPRASSPKQVAQPPLPLARWSKEKIRGILEGYNLEHLHQFLIAKGLGQGLGLSTITSEAHLVEELAEFVTSKKMNNINVKSLFTLISQWKKVDSLRNKSCACAH